LNKYFSAVEYFIALFILYSYGYLECKSDEEKIIRFFKIINCLPFDLFGVIAHRILGLSHDIPRFNYVKKAIIHYLT
jgi:hypothetical protein